LSGVWGEVWKLLLCGFATVGFVTFMGVVAFAVEPHYSGARERFRIRVQNWRMWRGLPPPPDYGTLPPSWSRGGRLPRRPK